MSDKYWELNAEFDAVKSALEIAKKRNLSELRYGLVGLLCIIHDEMRKELVNDIANMFDSIL